MCPYCGSDKRPNAQHLRMHGKTLSDMGVEHPVAYEQHMLFVNQRAKTAYKVTPQFQLAGTAARVLNRQTSRTDCKWCNESFQQSAINQQYCSRVCAANANGAKRKQSRLSRGIQVDKEQGLITLDPLWFRECKSLPPLPVKILRSSFEYCYFQVCKRCGKTECLRRPTTASACRKCRLNDLDEYRTMCRFRFDLKMYPDRFDLEALRVLKMFHPKRNPNGMSRDHLYSVNDGFINRVSPEIMKHPANCNLITQQENSSKHSRSAITLDELMLRIEHW